MVPGTGRPTPHPRWIRTHVRKPHSTALRLNEMPQEPERYAIEIVKAHDPVWDYFDQVIGKSLTLETQVLWLGLIRASRRLQGCGRVCGQLPAHRAAPHTGMRGEFGRDVEEMAAASAVQGDGT